MSATGRGAERVERDYYQTPAWCTRAIIPHLPRVSWIVDPCAGTGAILEVLAEQYLHSSLMAYELDADRFDECNSKYFNGICCDALQVDWDIPELVVMNPPFSLAKEFIDKALSEVAARGSVFALLRLNFLGSQKRAQWWREHPADVYVLPRRPSFKRGETDNCEYAWFAWPPKDSYPVGRVRILDVERRGAR